MDSSPRTNRKKDLCRRLSLLVKGFMGPYQAGFMESRATTDQLFSLRKILQNCREYNVPTHHVFIDFKAAYDTVDREGMDEYRFSDKLTRLIKAAMDRVMCYVRVSGVLVDPFESRRGLRQGNDLSCALFNIALAVKVRKAGIDTKGTISQSQFNYLASLMTLTSDGSGNLHPTES